MTKITMDALSETAKLSIQNKESFMIEKAKRVEQCKQMFANKCDELRTIYFDENKENSIVCSVKRAVLKHGGKWKNVDLYMNFEISHFCNWNKFVPYKADTYGKNYNARPSSCLNAFLLDCKSKGYLENIDFEVWGNRKFTVKFTIKLVNKEKKQIDEAE